MKKILTIAAATFALGIGTAHAAGDAAAGKKVFNKCRACHKVEEGKKSPVGPNLFGVFGRGRRRRLQALLQGHEEFRHYLG